MIKPSEFTPLSAIKLKELLEAAGVPQGVVEVVVGDGTTVHLSSGDGTWRASGAVAGDRIEGVLRDAKGALWIRTQS